MRGYIRQELNVDRRLMCACVPDHTYTFYFVMAISLNSVAISSDSCKQVEA